MARDGLNSAREVARSMLSSDSDFNSKGAGFVNGFDGKDPVYDIYEDYDCSVRVR